MPAPSSLEEPDILRREDYKKRKYCRGWKKEKDERGGNSKALGQEGH